MEIIESEVEARTISLQGSTVVSQTSPSFRMLPSLNIWLDYFHCSFSKCSCVLVCTLNPDFWDYFPYEAHSPDFQIIINPTTFEKNVLQFWQKRGWFTDFLTSFCAFYRTASVHIWTIYPSVAFALFLDPHNGNNIHTDRHFIKPSWGFWGP